MSGYLCKVCDFHIDGPHDEIADDIADHEEWHRDREVRTPTPAPLRMLRMRAAATKNAARVGINDLTARGCPTPPPVWAESVDGQLHLGSSTYRSAHVTIPLRGYEAWFDHSTDQDDRIHMATLTAQLQQRGNRSHPCIAFERNSGEDGDPKWRGVAKYELSIDEAVSLAHTLLLLVDVATGVTDESSED
ncbi:hypothetical protein L1080_023365 [Rhodococcus sp. MSC1_016]|jgi:hypothetical protein|uniref:hypothetical protein n=1 Tax=Rhodococcus sp. MSC1_016 TaxID=2909266 RepID=UPI00202E8B0F|nr:hypothetical protein [Rhodococcus sp. MSC1_016]